ncbi:MAG TPA: prepilin-type N-terminal cleavage/methylation domain-containing protein [Jatrophihabitans sp.]|jgi:general secretion pathway protein G|uniref:type II secretion system protein n=1 Tax=Jatrophihabitans sp. TaxID=1932789 RepID=UPI002E0948A6|nr:prepilin-type N-terminal cleavage/methylation domain-containing protein [Jatrophihabitans sp.]
MYKQLKAARENESGFTLIELLIVIVILGVLAGIVVFAVSGINDNSKASACKSDVKNVEVAGEAYYAQNKAYPTTAADAQAKLVPGYLHSWPTGTTIGWTYTAASGGTPASFAVTGNNGGSTC